MKRTGKVINVEKNKVYLLTKDKEFITVRKNEIEPKIGNIYTGTVITKKSIFQKLFALILLLLILSGVAFVFNNTSPKYTIIADLNCNIRFEVTSSGKITNVSSKDSKGISLINDTNVTGNNINDGLMILFDEALEKKQLTIPNGYYVGEILIFITSESSKSQIDLQKFIDYAQKNKFIVTVNNNTGEFLE
ncbi:MAG: hypothetical protein ACRCW0_04365 [Clostridium sp.]